MSYSNGGWVKFYRKTFDNPMLSKDNDMFVLWMRLLSMAATQQRKITFGGKEIILEPGQLITSREELAVNSNVNSSKIERFLKKLEIEHQIEQQTSNKNRIITILNWSKYQKTNSKTNINRTTTEQQSEQQIEHKQEYIKKYNKNYKNNNNARARAREDALSSSNALSGEKGNEECPFNWKVDKNQF